MYRTYAVRQNVTLGKNVHIGIGSILWAPGHLDVGNDVYIGKYCTIECDGVVGDHVMIANQVGLIGRHDHDMRCVGKPIRQAPWIGDSEYRGQGRDLRVIIGADVWVGFGSIILTGVSVGRGAIVAAGSVVVQDVEPYAIVAGNPARKVGYRFSPEQVREHEALVYGQVNQ